MAALHGKSLKRQALWVVGCRVVGIAATLASNIVAARVLGPAQFGTYLLVTVIIALGSLLGMAGMNEAALRFISESLALEKLGLARSYMRRALRFAAIASVLSAVFMCLAVAWWGRVAPDANQQVMLALIGAGILLLAWQQLGAELTRAHGELRLASLFSGGQAGGPISNLLLLAGLVTIAAVGGPLTAVSATAVTIISIAITCPLVYLGLWRLSRGAASRRDNFHELSELQRRELFSVGFVLLINQLLAFASQQFDLWIAGGLLTQESLGLYGAAKRSLLVAAMPVQMAMLTIVSTIPRLHALGRASELERVVRRAATAAAIPALVALGVLTLFPRQILGAVLGASYVGADSTLLVLLAGHYVLVLSGNPQQVLTMTGRHRVVLAVNLVCAVLLVVVGGLGAAWFGAPGLAAGSTASLAMQNAVLWWVARRDLGIRTHVDFLHAVEQRIAAPAAGKSAAPRHLESRPTCEPAPDLLPAAEQ